MDYENTLSTYGGLPPSAFVLDSPVANSLVAASTSCPSNPKTDVDIVLDHSIETKRPKLSKKLPKTIFSASSKALLNSSFASNPYPEKRTLNDLASRTKLTIKQVRTFFGNKRSRTTPDDHRRITDFGDNFPAESQALGICPKSTDVLPMPLNRSSLERLDTECASSTRSIADSLALSRFLEISIEDDHVDPAVIEISARESPPPRIAIRQRVPSIRANSLYSSTAGSVQSASSAWNSSLHGTSGTNGSVASHISSYSTRSHASRISKRGRRKYYGPPRIRRGSWLDSIQRAIPSPSAPATDDSYPTTPFLSELPSSANDTELSENGPTCRYICTFCKQGCSSRYSWKRHEESIHVPRTWWICNSILCTERSAAERTFCRKDNFEQHLIQTHKYTTWQTAQIMKDAQVSAPPLPLDDPALRCPFCSVVSATWETRVEHVAAHYRAMEIEALLHKLGSQI